MKKIVIIFMVLVMMFLLSGTAIVNSGNASQSYYVSTDGNDNSPGSLSQPWRTIGKAANTVAAGSTVYVRGGVYNEQVPVNVSGSAGAGYITLRNYEGEAPVLDGTGLTVSTDTLQNGLFLIVDRSYIIIQGFEIRNYSSITTDAAPVGININGKAHHIQIRNNRIHHIETNADLIGADAHGIAVYGTAAPESINNIIIDGNELYSLKLGSSEALVLNGNVELFSVTKNIVHDVDNIAIDFIGFEETSPDPAYDQARDGLVSGNTIYNVTSYGNSSYGNIYSAGGIYVDGGKDIIIEKNEIYNADIGIELASEHQGRATSGIILRNNVIFNNNIAGISIGGYDTDRGSTEDCIIVNNTLYHNDTRKEGNGELSLNYDTRSNTITNNIFYANDQGLLIGNVYTENADNVLDYNLYFSIVSDEAITWQWKNQDYEGFAAYQSGTGNDTHSLFADPQFVNVN